ncbi:YpiF family protein [Bacillus sp. BRMEA1]|uniref:YpiF family protein n=1 Tax=Neobacillus endophyticus TaxID=2738405 RepID=UPI00156527DC|nr:YpiF family protein [Neobacillus endophyticus]NRD80564.1 YpiF family protein [Neobacillus endophyticus]
MKWIPQDLETYLNAKEYVDTAVVPLYGISTMDGLKQSAEAAEFITLLTTHLERQFTGRILLFPPFTYLSRVQNERLVNDLLEWESEIKMAEFKHLFYITADSNWRNVEGSLQGSFIWLPSLPLGQMSDSQKFEMIDNQVKQLFSIFSQIWAENE